MDKNKLLEILKKTYPKKESINFINAHCILFSLPNKLQEQIKIKLKMKTNAKEETKHHLKMCFICVRYICFVAISIVIISSKLTNPTWGKGDKKWIDVFIEFSKTKRFSEIEKIISFEDILKANHLFHNYSYQRRV